MSHGPAPLPEVEHLSTPQSFFWLLFLAFDWLVIIGAIVLALLFPSWWLYSIVVIVIGSRQNALGVLGHDGAHGHGVQSLWLNDLLTNLFCFWPIGMDLAAYRAYHFEHHKYAGTVDDPELESKYWAGPNWDTPLTKKGMVLNFLLDLTGIGLLIYKRRVVMAFFKGYFFKRRDQEEEKRSLFFMHRDWWSIVRFGYLAAIIVVLGMLDLWPALLLFMVSIATAGFAFLRVRIWTEHGGIYGTHRFHPTWWQRYIFFPHNTWCHYEHHKWSTVPLVNLPSARLLDTSVPVVTMGEVFRAIAQAPIIPSGALPNGDLPLSVRNIA
jgi:fatty acid desaturase